MEKTSNDISEKKEHDRRQNNRYFRNYFVGGYDQLQYGFVLAAVSMIGYLATVFAFAYVHIAPDFELCAAEGPGYCQILKLSSFLNSSPNLHLDVLVVFLLGLFNMVVYFLLGVMISHRTFGPIHKIENALEKLVSGKYDVDFQLRRNDHLEGVASKLSLLAKRLKN